MHIICFLFYCIGVKKLPLSVKKWEREGTNIKLPGESILFQPNYSNTHHIIITTSEFINRTLPGGLESISLYQGESFLLVYVHKLFYSITPLKMTALATLIML